MRARRLFAPVLAFAALSWACGGGDLSLPTGPQTTIQILQGDDQVGLPGQRLDDPLVVRLLDPNGVGIANRTVVWVVNAGGGSITPTTGMTDAEGFASAEWVLGPTAGPNRLEAQVPGIGSVTFSAVATPDGRPPEPSGAASTIEAAPSSIPAGTGTATITVTVRDENGAPVSGATVVLAASGDGVTLTQPSEPTGDDGVATGTLQSSVAGQKVVSATVNGSIALSRTATVAVTPGQSPALTIEAIEGTGQSAPAGAPVAERPAVRVTDQTGAPVGGVPVAFEVTGGGGTVTGALQTTSADGIARVGGWTLGPTPGANTLQATAAAQGSPVVFTAQGTAGESQVARLVYRVPPPARVVRGQSFQVAVALVDADGDIVPLDGIFIYLGLFEEGDDSPTNDELGGERFENTEDGVAVFQISVDEEGRWRLRALTDDLPELGPHGPEPYLFSQVFEVE